MTAHPQFEYAHQAIRLGVTDFLLKPFTREELQKALMQAIDQVLRLQENMRNEQQHVSENTPPVEWAKRYVQEHIQQDIDMSYIANCLNLSYSYFSKLFRQETGTNFSSYVVEEKMKAAGKCSARVVEPARLPSCWAMKPHRISAVPLQNTGDAPRVNIESNKAYCRNSRISPPTPCRNH